VQVLKQIEVGILAPELYCEHGILIMVAWPPVLVSRLKEIEDENPSIKGMYAVNLCRYPKK
jgi:hypothetical protein